MRDGMGPTEMNDQIWLFHEVNRFEMAWGICASLWCHLLLVLILTETSRYVPPVGTVPRFDLVWVTPALAPLEIPASAKVPPPEPPEAAQDIAEQPSLGGTDPTYAPAPLVAPAEKSPDAPEVSPPVARGAQPKEKRRDPPADQALQSAEAAGQAKLPQPEEEGGPQALLEKAAQDEAARERIADTARRSRQEEQIRRHAGRQLPREQAAGDRAVGEGNPTPEARLEQHFASPPPATVAATAGDLPPDTGHRTAKPLPRVNAPTPAANFQEARGLVIAPLRGDLKLVITGDNALKLSVTFGAYPNSRRSRGLTRSEARRLETIVPVLTQIREDTRVAVIETTREGIYVFSAETGEGNKARATFTLTAFEAGPWEKRADLGTRTITGKAVLSKILMPDAILWDDDAAFSGVMEDSESVVKFNTKTGLYWKEYNN